MDEWEQRLRDRQGNAQQHAYDVDAALAELEHLRAALRKVKATEPAEYIRQLETDRDNHWQAEANLREDLDEARAAARHVWLRIEHGISEPEIQSWYPWLLGDPRTDAVIARWLTSTSDAAVEGLIDTVADLVTEGRAQLSEVEVAELYRRARSLDVERGALRAENARLKAAADLASNAAPREGEAGSRAG